MRFYSGQCQFYAGIDLHARKMFICLISAHHPHQQFSLLPATRQRYYPLPATNLFHSTRHPLKLMRYPTGIPESLR